MTKYYYTCEQDKKLIINSFDYLALLIFGKNNLNKVEAFKQYFEERVSEVNIYPQGITTSYLNKSTPGICRLNDEGSLVIEMLGYYEAKKEQYSWIEHEGLHEFCHSFVDLLLELMPKNRNGIIKNGILCSNYMGMIREQDPKTGSLVGQHYYGKMFNETMMDIITSMAINCFDANERNRNVDNILKLNFNDWGNETTGYSIFTSITRLAIAAFSNSGFTNYQSIVDKGYGLFDGKVKMDNGEIYKINDFLYGIVYGQLHIEEEFDRFMGIGSYKKFCEYLDRLFVMSLNNQKIPSGEVKKIMNILPDFLNRKINFYKTNNIITIQGANRIVGNFNQIWNSMQQEYGAYFTEEDIDVIAKRASRN